MCQRCWCSPTRHTTPSSLSFYPGPSVPVPFYLHSPCPFVVINFLSLSQSLCPCRCSPVSVPMCVLVPDTLSLFLFLSLCSCPCTCRYHHRSVPVCITLSPFLSLSRFPSVCPSVSLSLSSCPYVWPCPSPPL